jgi:aspartate kinase
VVKYGGSVLEDGPSIRRAAEAIKEELEKGTSVVVVASAIRGVTDQLLAAASTISDYTPLDVVDHIIGLGEEQSVRLLASALKSLGVPAIEITPDQPSWPIVSDEKFGDAEPVLEECRSSVALGLKPLVDRGKVPVVCGFIGRSSRGRITTLGRSGSDTTAVVLAACLDADELILVKDTGGVYSADPKKVPSAKPLRELSSWEAELLASNGAKVLQGKVFRYKPDTLPIRIVSKDQPLSGEGTLITGTIPELEVSINKDPVTVLTTIGDTVSDPKSIAGLSNAVEEAGGKVLLIHADNHSAIIIVEGAPVGLISRVHSVPCVKAVSSISDLSLITVNGTGFDPCTGITLTVSALNGIGVKVSLLLFGPQGLNVLVAWEMRDACRHVLETALSRCTRVGVNVV